MATDLVVLSAARDAHDHDYRAEVIEDATATTDEELHEAAPKIIKRTATVTTVEKALPPEHIGAGRSSAH